VKLDLMANRPTPDPLLRADVRLLGELLGEVIREQEGPELLALEEDIRTLAVARRRGPKRGRAEAAEKLVQRLSALRPEQAEQVVRAFATWFQLVNLAEQHQRLRRTRAQEFSGEVVRGSVEAALVALRDAGVSAARVREALMRLRITLTLTAHPTQSVRRTVLQRLYDLERHLSERDRCELTPREKESFVRSLREDLTVLWQTD